jgi:hypothetical protein
VFFIGSKHIITKQWFDFFNPDAKKLRDNEAKRLKKEGFKVKKENWNCSIERGSKCFKLRAERPISFK